MERIVKFTPAFDKRNSDPSKNYGIHGVDLLMYLKGELGAVQFVVYTNWMLPHVQEELLNKNIGDRLGIKCCFIPMPADIGYHSPNPMYENQYCSDNCHLLDEKQCYYDGSGIHAEEVFKILVEHGDEKVWEHLENYYVDVFGELR